MKGFPNYEKSNVHLYSVVISRDTDSSAHIKLTVTADNFKGAMVKASRYFGLKGFRWGYTHGDMACYIASAMGCRATITCVTSQKEG